MKFLINIDCLGTYNVEYKQSNFVKINFPEQWEGIYFLAALKIACAQNLKVETHFEFMDKKFVMCFINWSIMFLQSQNAN
jgi:hypothetical protein